MKAKLEIENLTKEFPSRHGPTVALSNVDLTVGEGELVTIVGASGCGEINPAGDYRRLHGAYLRPGPPRR